MIPDKFEFMFCVRWFEVAIHPRKGCDCRQNTRHNVKQGHHGSPWPLKTSETLLSLSERTRSSAGNDFCMKRKFGVKEKARHISEHISHEHVAGRDQ